MSGHVEHEKHAKRLDCPECCECAYRRGAHQMVATAIRTMGTHDPVEFLKVLERVLRDMRSDSRPYSWYADEAVKRAINKLLGKKVRA